MKKSNIALAIIAVLAAGWVGGAWFTGKKAEEEYQHQLVEANKKLQQAMQGSGYSLQFENSTFNRGIFSSDVDYDIVFTEVEKKNEVKLPITGKLHHGPLPLDQVSKFNFAPAIFSAYFTLANKPDTKAWFDATKGKAPFESVTTLGYDLKAKGSMKINAGEIDGENKVTWSEANLVYHVDKSGAGETDFTMANLNANIVNTSNDPENNNKNTQIDVKDLKITSDLQMTEWKNIVVGKQAGKFGLINVTSTDKLDQKESLSFKDWDFAYIANIKDKFINYDVKNLLSISLNEMNLGKLQADFQLNHLQADALNTVLEAGQTMDPKLTAALQNALQKLVENQPHLKFSPFVLSNESGKLDVNVNIELSQADMSKLLNGKVLSLFKQLQLNLDADKAAVEKILAVISQTAGMSKEESEALAKTQVEQIVNELKAPNYVVDAGSKVKSNLVLENNELKLNGVVIPEESIAMIFLGMFLGR